MVAIVGNAGESTFGENLPVSRQYGDRTFLYFPRKRPMVLMPGENNNYPKLYNCGIKAPFNNVTTTNSSDNAVFISDGTELTFAYAYYSSVRNVYSQLSPAVTITAATPAKKIIVGGFYAPRDSAIDQDIDTVVIAVQSSVTPGLMCVLPDMQYTFDPADLSTLSSATITFDMDAGMLNQGFNYSNLDQYLFVPPAVKYAERFKERLWLGGQTEKETLPDVAMRVVKAELDGTLAITSGSATVAGTGTAFTSQLTIGDVVVIRNPAGDDILVGVAAVGTSTSFTATANFSDTLSGLTAYRTYRGEAVARLELTQPTWSTGSYFDDFLLYRKVIINGQYVGDVFDITGGNAAYLDRDVSESIASSTNFSFVGYNDRIWATAYTTEQPGVVPTPFPECVPLFDYQLITQMIDEGQKLQGMAASRDFLNLIFDQTVAAMAGGDEPDVPVEVLIRTQYGRTGCIAPRSICKDPGGNLAWIGNEGIVISDTDGIRSLMHEIGCNQFWKGSPWVDVASLPQAVMCYSRQFFGYVFGNIQVNKRTLTGTLAINSAGTTVTGTSTLFTTECKVGEILTIGDYDMNIEAIASATSMTVSPYLGPTNITGATATIGKGWWGILSLRPQLDLFLFNGQIITSNIIEYLNDDGEGVLLAGDAYSGRVKRLLDGEVLTDLKASAMTTGDYVCEWREGWRWMPNLKTFTPVRWRPNIIVPGATLSMTLSGWRSNIVQRDERDIPAASKSTQTVTHTTLAGVTDIGFGVGWGHARYHSLGIEWVASSGADTNPTRPIEVTRWQTEDKTEAAPL